MNIILAATGSVASIKYWKLLNKLKDIGDVKGILTEKAEFFAKIGLNDKQSDGKYIDFESIAKENQIYTNIDEWNWSRIGNPIQHIDLKDWADILVIAPLSANTLTKMYLGLCDDLLTTMYYAWNNNKPIIVAPAMNTDMLNNPLTTKHLNELKNRHSKFTIVEPVFSKLACGVEGKGAMAPTSIIVEKVKLTYDEFKF